MRSTGSSLRAAVFLIASGLGASQMQNVFSRSSLTYEWTQVTPSSAFRSTTARQSAAPSPSAGIGSPSVNVRSTRYRGNSLLLPSATLLAFDGRRGARPAHRPNYPGCSAALPILAGEPEQGPKYLELTRSQVGGILRAAGARWRGASRPEGSIKAAFP